MSKIEINKELISSYLLGRLNEELQAEDLLQVEEQLYLNESYFEQMQRVEQDLMSRRVRGELSRDDNQRFESYFLRAPERKKQFAFHQSLHQVTGEYMESLAPLRARGASAALESARAPMAHATSATTVSNESESVQITQSTVARSFGERLAVWWQSLALMPQLGFAAAVCGLLMTSGLAWSLWQNVRSSEQFKQEQLAYVKKVEEREQQAVNDLSKKNADLESQIRGLEQTQGDKRGTSVRLTALDTGASKGGGTPTPAQKVTLPASVRLSFAVPRNQNYAQYQVSILRGSEKVWGMKPFTLKSDNLTITVASDSLKADGRYQVIVSGVNNGVAEEAVAVYLLDITHR